MDRHFGLIPSPFDARDRKLPFHGYQALTDRKWEFPAKSLDQLVTYHCVGFMMAGYGINLPTYTPYTNEDGHEFYYQCKILEGDPTGERGCYMRSGATVLRNLKLIDAYAFAPDVPSLLWWLANKSPLMVGTMWTSRMDTPDEAGIMTIGGTQLGHHAYIVNELIGDYIGIQNSWGDDWGDNGKAYMLITDFIELFKNYGEAITTLELEPVIELEPEPEPELEPELEPEPEPDPIVLPPGCLPLSKVLSKLFRKK